MNMSTMESSSNEGGGQSGSNARVAAAADGGSQSGKGSYSGVVAQRALYGSYKRRFGRRVANKSAPSRLSKASAGDGNSS